jgi:hypothetical protein
VAVWTRFDGTVDRIESAARTAAGPLFGAATQISPATFEAFEPMVSMDGSGNAVAIWSQYNGTIFRTQVATRPAGGSFGATSAISATGADAFGQQIDLAPNGSGVAIWTRPDGSGRIRTEASVRSTGGTFGSVQVISPSTEDAFDPHVAVSNTNEAVAVWYGQPSAITKLRIKSSSKPASGSFATATTLSDTTQDAFDAQVDVVGASGEAVAVWDRFDGTNNRTQTATRPSGGSFGAATTISPAAQSSVGPQVDLDPNGKALVVWYRNDATLSTNQAQAIERPAGGSFGPIENISEPGQPTFKPEVDQSATNAVAVWYRSDGTKSRAQSNAREVYDTPRGARRLYVSLVPSFRQTISSTQCASRGGTPSAHGAPFSFLSCDPPALTPGTQAFFGPKARGYVQYLSIGPDVVFTASLIDVQNSVDADYSPDPSGPDITVVSRHRVTDHDNTTSSRVCSPNCHSTVLDYDFGVPVNCVTNSDPLTGSNCSAITSYNAVTPASVKDGVGTNMPIFRVRINDSGANGVRGDTDDRNFAMSGFYNR